MNWINIAWPMMAAASVTLALIHFSIWLKVRTRAAHLMFVFLAMSVAVIAACELMMMRAQTPAEFGTILRWMHLPLFIGIVSIVGFVHFYFRAGYAWLAYSVIGVRMLALAINYFADTNINYLRVTALHTKPILGGETVSVAEGVANPAGRIAELGLVLLLAFVASAWVEVWKRGDRDARRRAAIICGSLVIFILAGSANAILIHAGIVQMPYFITALFLLVITAVGYELGSDVIRVAQLSERLGASQAQIRASEQRMALVTSATNLGLWEWDVIRDAMWITPKGRELLGLSPQQSGGLEDFLEQVHREDRDEVRRAIHRALGGSGTYEQEFRVGHPDSPARWIAARGQVEFDRDHKAAFVRGVALDISGRKQAELEVARQHDELAHLSRVVLLGELSGSIAHELNQPLMAILSNAQAAEHLLARDPLDTALIKEFLADIIKNDKRAGEIIRRLSAMFRKEETQYQPLNANDVVREALALARSDLNRRGITVRVELLPTLPLVRGDRIQLQQVLLNLVTNACDAIDGSGGHRQLSVQTRVSGGDDVEIAVVDSGRGISPDDLERILDPFVSTKPHGMGLGLTICRTIVEAHGGRLWATNNEERGATMHVALPAARK